MKAKITEVKKIVPKQGGQGGGQGGEQPKNIETFGEGPDDEGTEDQPGSEGPEKPGDPQNKDQKSGKGKKGQDDQGGQPSKGSGKGSGPDKGTGWEEVDPIDPRASYEVTPWQKPSGKTVIGEVVPTGSLGEGPTDNEKMKEEWKQITTAAESQSQGNIPGGIRSALERMRAPVIDWKRELETKNAPELEFAWSSDLVEKLNRCTILHNAGIVGDYANGYPAFYKGKYHLGKDPFTDDHLNTVLNSEESAKYCTHYYLTQLFELKNKYNLNYNP
jgi:hypothetical protein